MMNVQRTYKLRGTGQIGEFPASEGHAIIDLRELESRYEWVTLERHPLDFNVTMAVGDTGLGLAVPFHGAGRMVLSSDLTVRLSHPLPGVTGEFGPGFATMKPGPGISLGPISTPPGLRFQTLRVLDTGEVRLHTVTIMARNPGILKFFLNPIAWGKDVAYRITVGRFLSMPTAEEVERYILSAHAIRLRDGLLGTRAAWQQVRDWLDPAGIPAWIEKGEAT
jgi:hypothetical protein